MNTQLTEDQLNRLTDDEIKRLYHGILAMRQTKAGRALIDQSIAEIRSGRFQSQQHPTPVKATQDFVEMIDHEKALGKPALRASLLGEVLGDATWQPTFVFYMGYSKWTAHASPRRSIESVIL